MVNLKSFDLNLLRVLNALLSEQSTTRAAEQLGLSQPAVSSALGRLRAALGDQLLVRQGHRMVRTPLADDLVTPVADIINRIEATLNSAETFDPVTAENSFLLAGSDYFAELLMPRLAETMLLKAPGMQVRLIGLDPTDYLRSVEDGRVDLALVPEFALSDNLSSRKLYDSKFSVIARKDHQRIAGAGITPGDTMPLEVFLNETHIAYSVEGRPAVQTDAALRKEGHQRKVAMTMADFSGVYRTVSRSDMISVIPEELAVDVEKSARVSRYALPIQSISVPLFMAWHTKTANAPAHNWLRKQIAEECCRISSQVLGRAD